MVLQGPEYFHLRRSKCNQIRYYLGDFGSMMLLKAPLSFLVGVMLFAWVVMCEIRISSGFGRSCGGCSGGCSGGGGRGGSRRS